MTSRARRELAQLEASGPNWATANPRLAAVLEGAAVKNNAERLALAQRAYDTFRYAAAVKLWGDALEADPKLADDRQAQTRFYAAGAAALVAEGEGEPAPNDETRAKLREQARMWLSAELETWTKLLESSKGQERDAVMRALAGWKYECDFLAVRDPGALATLPEAERKAWQALWAEVDERLGSIKPGHLW
jgi:hypothetical protein